MIGDLITALTVLAAIALAGGTLIVCLVVTFAHRERMADTRRETEAAQRDEARALRGVR
jgi:hypothetical protein